MEQGHKVEREEVGAIPLHQHIQSSSSSRHLHPHLRSHLPREAAAAKAAEAAARKAERDALLAAEENAQRATPKGSNVKAAQKKSKGTLDLSQLDHDSASDAVSDKKAPALNASNIDDALDVLSLTTANPNDLKIDRHPERRFKAAYKAFEERRLPEIEAENPGLRKQQRIEIARKEFEKSPENPFNQAGNVNYDAQKEEVEEQRKRVKEGVEGRLAEKS
jgi:Coiled-coil domain-containing protein 124 /Oxs1